MNYTLVGVLFIRVIIINNISTCDIMYKMADESMADESMADESKAEESIADKSMADEFKPKESKGDEYNSMAHGIHSLRNIEISEKINGCNIYGGEILRKKST